MHDDGSEIRSRGPRLSVQSGSSSPQESHTRNTRVAALDVARCLALIGMIAVNVGPEVGTSLAETIYRAPYGRASLLFVLLGGIGFALLTRRAQQNQEPVPWQTVLWRVGILVAAGLLVQELDHGVRVILTTYAALFLFGLPLVRASGRLLLLLAGLSMCLGPVLWIFMQERSGTGIEREPVTAASGPWEIILGTLLTGPYPAVVWAAPFLFGMWIGRQRLNDPKLSTRLIIWGAVAAVGARLLSATLVALVGEPSHHVEWHRLVSDVGHSEMPLWIIGSTGAAAFVLGVCLKIPGWNRMAAQPLVALGRIALTAYVLHLVVLALWIRPGPETLSGGVTATLSLVVGMGIFASLWFLRFRQGPLEMTLRLPRRR